MIDPVTITDPALRFASDHTQVSAAVVAWLSAWFLYGVLGKRYLGADDDFWEGIRATLIPLLATLAQTQGLYAETEVSQAEYVGSTDMPADKVERKLVEAGYLRQPLASVHRRPDGSIEQGSWSRPRGVMLPVSDIVSKIPVVGGIPGRFIRSLDTVAARRQTHIMLYEEGDRVKLYAHAEANPLNPIMAPKHYAGAGFEPAPDRARTHLERVGVSIRDRT